LLRELCDDIGARLSGSEELDLAVDWASAEMEKWPGVTVDRQPVQVPRWVRGTESVEVLAPRARSLAMLGLGMSVGTPPEGLEADLLVVTSFDELESLGRAAVEGRIVLYTFLSRPTERLFVTEFAARVAQLPSGRWGHSFAR